MAAADLRMHNAAVGQGGSYDRGRHIHGESLHDSQDGCSNHDGLTVPLYVSVRRSVSCWDGSSPAVALGLGNLQTKILPHREFSASLTSSSMMTWSGRLTHQGPPKTRTESQAGEG